MEITSGRNKRSGLKRESFLDNNTEGGKAGKEECPKRKAESHQKLCVMRPTFGDAS